MRKFYVGDFPAIDKIDMDAFSNDKFKCVALFKTADEKPVVIGRGKNAMYPYMVSHGVSTFVFRTYNAAYKYCEQRFIKVKGEKQHE